MSLFVLGVNHKTASVSLREKIAFSPEKIEQAMFSLLALTPVIGCVVLSTCNRTEIYLNTVSKSELKKTIIDWLCEFHQLQQEEIEPCLYWYSDKQVITHLMRVSCGLDSLVIGEPQILGQVKQAFHLSQKKQALSTELTRLFQKSFSVAKRVRTETEIGANAVSIAFAACALARKIFESLADVTVLLVGAGETIDLVARHLKNHQVEKLIIANRSLDRAHLLGSQVNADVITLNEIGEHLHKADIIISSTASPLPIIGKGIVESALKRRRYQPMLFIDIAVPRDVEPEVGDLSEVYLYSVDDLHSIIEHNVAQRHVAATQAEQIIHAESEQFMLWLRSLDAVDVIRKYRHRSEKIRAMLVERALNAVEQGGDVTDIINELAHKLTNKLMHEPTKSLQQAASLGRAEHFQILRASLGLDED